MNPQEVQKWNQQLIRQALEILDKKGIKAVCPACRKSDIQADIGAFALAAINYSQTSVAPMVPPLAMMYQIASTAGFPVVSLTCMNCGHTQIFNLRVLGIVRDPAIPGAQPQINLPSGWPSQFR